MGTLLARGSLETVANGVRDGFPDSDGLVTVTISYQNTL